MSSKGFPAGSVVKNLPANVRDMGQVPDPGRSHMIHSNHWVCALESRSRNYWAHLLQDWSPCAMESLLHSKEEPPRWEALTRRLEISLRLP